MKIKEGSLYWYIKPCKKHKKAKLGKIKVCPKCYCVVKDK
jgi:hypothetical protein